MKKFFIILFIAFAISSCSQDLKDNFPTVLKTEKTVLHKRVSGSKIFAKIPDDYKYIENLSRYQKAEDLYIQFIETNASNFYQAKPNFSREIIESKGAKVDILKDITFNDLDAVYGDGPSKESGERKALFVFGDNEFVVIAIGVYPKNNPVGRNEVLDVFKNLFYQKDFKTDPFELANFEFDLSITGFKYAMTMSNMFTYTKDGKPESVGEFTTSMNIGAMPKMSVEQSGAFIKSIIQNATNSGKEIKSPEIQITEIGNYTGSILDTEIEVEKKKGAFYIVVLNGDDSSVIFMGAAFENQAELLQQFKETIGTIRIK